VDGAPNGISVPRRLFVETPSEGKPSIAKSIQKLSSVTRVGLDLAKSVFQVHGVGAQGEVVIARKLRRGTMLEFFGRLAPCVVPSQAAAQQGGMTLRVEQGIAFNDKAIVFDLLFRTAAETLITIAADPKHLGARIGLTTVLHTWGSTLTHHPHIHVIVPGGGLSPDGSRWIACSPASSCPCASSRACSAAFSSKASRR
jgi:hypothetical protein